MVWWAIHAAPAASAAMAAPLTSSRLARCAAVLHGYGTSPLEGGGCTNFWQCELIATLFWQCCLIGTPGHQQKDLLSHSVTLSWHWVNQFLHYPNNVEHQARKQKVSIVKSLFWNRPGFEKKKDPDSNPWPLDSPTSQNGKRALLLTPIYLLRLVGGISGHYLPVNVNR